MFDFQDNLIKCLNVRITFHLDNQHRESKNHKPIKFIYFLNVKITCYIQVYKILYRFFIGEFLLPSHKSAFIHCRIESSFFQLFSTSVRSTSSTSMRTMNYQRGFIQEFWKTIFTLKKLQEKMREFDEKPHFQFESG